MLTQHDRDVLRQGVICGRVERIASMSDPSLPKQHFRPRTDLLARPCPASSTRSGSPTIGSGQKLSDTNRVESQIGRAQHTCRAAASVVPAPIIGAISISINTSNCILRCSRGYIESPSGLEESISQSGVWNWTGAMLNPSCSACSAYEPSHIIEFPL